MATSVTISNAPNIPNGGKGMMVDYGIVEVNTAADAVITFTNSLASPAKDIEISFFPGDTLAGDKTDTTNAIAGFCTEMASSKVLTVPTGPANCTIADSMAGKSYLYTLTADSPYIDLDPVIIVEGGGVRPFLIRPEFQLPAIVIGVALIVLAAYLGYKRGFSAGGSS